MTSIETIIKSQTEQTKSAYFLSLTMANVRCFGEQQTLNLSTSDGRPARWTILLGNNGTGKTTLLQALVTSAGQLSESGTQWSSERYVRAGKELHVDVVVDAVIRYADSLNASVGQELRLSLDSMFDTTPLCFAYGASRRMDDGQLSGNNETGPCGSLFNDGAPLRNAEEWLLQLDYSASKAKVRSAEAKRWKARLDQVQNILIDLLPDISGIRFKSPGKSRPMPRVEFKTSFGWVPLREIAYGYQSLIAWTVDLASRLVEAYPESDDPLAEPAVVLIDEIDLHLHPSWQRDLLKFLTEKFSNTQFIATAHSPLVVQAAPTVDANLALLERQDDQVIIRNDLESVRGWRIDQVLASDLYQTSTRTDDIQSLINERRRLLGKSKLTKEDKLRLESLGTEIGELPTGESPD